MREIEVAGASIDAGPTVFTMRWVFDEIFAKIGTSLEAQLTLKPADILARHAWSRTNGLIYLRILTDRPMPLVRSPALAKRIASGRFRIGRAESIRRLKILSFAQNVPTPSPLSVEPGSKVWAASGAARRSRPYGTS